MQMPVIEEHLEEIVERCVQAIETQGFPDAESWKRAVPGRAIVGCFPVYSPVEVFHAAGMLPVGLCGGGNRMEIAHADSRFQSFVCSIVKSTLEQGMTGVLADFDALVFHSICDPARNLASVYRRNFPGKKIEYIHFPQNFEAPEATVYLVREYARVAESMSELTGRSVRAEDLQASIDTYDAVRRLVRQLYAVRSDTPHLLSTRELYSLVRYGYLVPPEEHLEVLTRALAALSERQGRPRDRVRAILVGSFCEQPPIDLIGAIEDAGCYLVDDDFLIGRRWFVGDVSRRSSDPYLALAQSYMDASVSTPVKHDLRVSKSAALVERARRHSADAVIVLCAKFCEPALFEYPLYRRALQDAGIPHIFLEFEEKMWMFDRTRTEIETFVESLLFA